MHLHENSLPIKSSPCPATEGQDASRPGCLGPTAAPGPYLTLQQTGTPLLLG